MADTSTFDPVAAGFRVASGPIERKPRRPSSKPQPKPQYADSVWWSFQNDSPLEVSVPVRSVEDTVRKLKRAARYLERTKSTANKKVEVRVQIGVEPDPDKTKNSVVKFLGHEPWALGRRIAKMEADAREAGQEAGEQAAADALARVPAQPRHRRTTAGTRPVGRHSKASLLDALVWAVITPQRPSFPVTTPVRGSLCFSPAHTEFQAIVSRSLLPSYPGGTMSSPLQRRGGVYPGRVMVGRVGLWSVTASTLRWCRMTGHHLTPLKSGCAMTSQRCSQRARTASWSSTTACRCHPSGAQPTCPRRRGEFLPLEGSPVSTPDGGVYRPARDGPRR